MRPALLMEPPAVASTSGRPTGNLIKTTRSTPALKRAQSRAVQARGLYDSEVSGPPMRLPQLPPPPPPPPRRGPPPPPPPPLRDAKGGVLRRNLLLAGTAGVAGLASALRLADGGDEARLYSRGTADPYTAALDEFGLEQAASAAPPDLRILPTLGKLTVLGVSGQRYLVLPSRKRRDIMFLETSQGVRYVLQTKQAVNVNDMSLMRLVFADPSWEKVMRPYRRK